MTKIANKVSLAPHRTVAYRQGFEAAKAGNEIDVCTRMPGFKTGGGFNNARYCWHVGYLDATYATGHPTARKKD